MAITFPYDLLTGFPGWQSEFTLSRRQELSRSASGKTYVKDLGDPLWRAAYLTKEMKPNLLDKWRARLDVLDGGLFTFRAYVLSRCYPIAHPRGAWPGGVTWDGSGTLGTVAANRKEATFAGFPVGYVFSGGDIVMVGQGSIHRVVTGATVAGGASPFVELRPHLKTGVTAGAAVSVVRPWSLMQIDPDGRNDAAGLSGRGVVSFSATEAV